MPQDPVNSTRGLMVIVADTETSTEERSQALAHLLARLMAERNLTKAKLAERSGLSESYVRAILDGKSGRGNPVLPSGRTVKQIAAGLATNGHSLEVSPAEHRRLTIEMFVALGFLASDWTIELFSPEQSPLIRTFFPGILEDLALAAQHGISESELGLLPGLVHQLVEAELRARLGDARAAAAERPRPTDSN